MRIKFLPLLDWLFMPKKLYIFNPLDLLSTPTQPAAPDYRGAAVEEAEGHLEMAGYTTDVNRPDMYNPYGSSVWTQGPDVIDQTGYDAALAKYEAAPTPQYTQEEWDETGMAGPIPYSTSNLATPDIADYTTKSNDWTNTVQFSPEQKALYDQQTQNQLLQSQTAGAGLEAASGMFADPFSTSDYGSREGYQSPTGDMPTYSGPQDDLESYGENRQSVMDAMLARVTTDNALDIEQKESTLIARGIPRGSEAWAREMELLNRKKTDARQQAEISATQMANLDYDRTLAGRRQNVSELQDLYEGDMLSRTQGISEGKDTYNFGNDTYTNKIQDALLDRQTPLNEYSSLIGGTQVTNPAFQDFATQQQLLGPDYMGATTAQGNWDLAGWNAEVAGNNAIKSGLFDLGAAGIMA